jgi:hypothetical protein
MSHVWKQGMPPCQIKSVISAGEEPKTYLAARKKLNKMRRNLELDDKSSIRQQETCFT